MAKRVTVTKTYKLYLNGGFPRTESGRSIAVEDAGGKVIAHVSRASRKDLREAVEGARKALPAWAGRTAYNRGQILYRMAEMLEGKAEELAQTIKATTDVPVAEARKEVEASIDRLVCFSGWADKYAQVLGCNNPVAGPYYNFTVPQPTGVVCVVAPDEPALLGLVSLIAAPLCAGNTIVAVASEAHPLCAAVLAEVCGTSDVPPGAVNILTALRDELLEHCAGHRDIDAIASAGLSPEQVRTLQIGAAENVKRVHHERRSADGWYDADTCESPWTIEPYIEFKTIWHPAAV